MSGFHTIEEAIYELMQGNMVIVVDDEDRENEGDLVALAERGHPGGDQFHDHPRPGLVCVPITEERARELDLPPMVHHNTDYHGTAFTVSVDHINDHGISAHEVADGSRT